MGQNVYQLTRVSDARRRVLEQLLWIEEHGSDLAGYVVRYGRADDPNRYGEGGEAIYRADMADLEDRQADLDRAIGRRR